MDDRRWKLNEEIREKLKQAAQIHKQLEKLEYKSEVLNAEIKLCNDKKTKLLEEVKSLQSLHVEMNANIGKSP